MYFKINLKFINFRISFNLIKKKPYPSILINKVFLIWLDRVALYQLLSFSQVILKEREMKKEERLKVLFTETNIENDIPKLPDQLAGLSLNGL